MSENSVQLPCKATIPTVILFLVGCLLLNPACPVADSAEVESPPPSWPRFHGPRGGNLSRETGLLKVWPNGGPKLAWTAKGIGEGYSSVSIAYSRIYTSGNLREKTAITALDRDGNILWQAPAGEAWNGTYPGTRGTPTLDQERLYHESPLGEVVCLDAHSGREIWRLNLVDEFGAQIPTWGFAESLLVDGDRLICCPGGENASVVALEKNTGKLLWAAPSSGDLAAYASPILVEHRGLRMILAMTQNALIGVNADCGDLLFRHVHQTRFGANATMPLFHDGRIFITSGYGSGSEMLQLAVDAQKASVEPIWEAADLDNLHGGVVLVDGYLYAAAHQAKRSRQSPWVCLDWKTGRTRYAEKGVGMGSLTYADGMLYTLSEGGEVGLVEATPGSHELAGRFQLPIQGEDPTWAHPVVCGGFLYIRHESLLYAHDVRYPRSGH